mmetsp:Transcript_12307/g.37027  ORF Transcript_12307/g.37027 Transcript_12307/m.37027 type:complete len:435 (+) Transcript_12307:245-1549(+)
MSWLNGRAHSAAMQIDWGKLISLAISMGLSLIAMNYMLDRVDPSAQARAAAGAEREKLERRLGRRLPALEGLEAEVAAEVIDPDDVDVQLSDVGGLDDEQQTLSDSIILPLQHPEHFASGLLHQPNGVLLYGPPGTGKTMLAKAIAREAGATFIAVRSSTLQSKWFGQTQKMVRAVFSLANKLAPSIIFLDEVDGILGVRRAQDHEAVTSMKTEFMQLWDGLTSRRAFPVLVLGATNRQSDLDPAVLRRFTLQIRVPMPDTAARVAILRKILLQHGFTASVDPELLSEAPQEGGPCQLQVLAEATEGYSGSDLMELCSQSAVRAVHDFLRSRPEAQRRHAGSDSHSLAGNAETISSDACVSPPSETMPAAVSLQPRPLALRDLLAVVERNAPSRADAKTPCGEPADVSFLNDFMAQLLGPRGDSQGPPPGGALN